TLTTFSLAGMLLLTGIVVSTFPMVEDYPPSPFGKGKIHVFDTYVSYHQVVSLVVLVLLVSALTFLLFRTRFGIYVRSIADDPEGARLVGLPMAQVGTVVYALAGAVA